MPCPALAHLLIIDLPDGNDTDLVQAAMARGDRYTFVTGNAGAYRGQPAVQAVLDRARARIEVPGLAGPALKQRVLAVHASQPVDALLCGPGAHHADVAQLAQRLDCVFLNPVTAALLQDPLQWRQRLQARGLPQHALQHGNGNGNGGSKTAGLRLGRVIACDTLTQSGRHRLLGVHEPSLHPPPSTALRGNTFTPYLGNARSGPDTVERYLGAVLDALDVDCGATHTELAITAHGLQVVRIAAGLPGGRLPRLLGYALGRSLHADVIALHCGQPLPVGSGAAPQVAVLRSLAADREGVLDEVLLPTWQDPAIRCVELLRQPGQTVRPPLSNADHLGYVIVCGPSRADAEALADRYMARTLVQLRPTAEDDSTAPGLEFGASATCAASFQAQAPATIRPWPHNPPHHPPASLSPQPTQLLPPHPSAGCWKAAR